MSGVIEFILSRVAKRLDSSALDHDASERRRAHLESHVRFVDRWSGNVQFLGMPSPMATVDATVPLSLEEGARRFTSKTSHVSALDESGLLAGPQSYILLGDPGAGKTTTLKRLARKLLDAPRDNEDEFQYPVVIRLRDLGTEPNAVLCAIASELGIEYERYIEGSGGNQTERVRIGSDRIEKYVPEYLSTTGAVVLLDGLDEMSLAARHRAMDDIVRLGLTLTGAKVIVTCRAGDYVRQAEGLYVVSLRALNPGQIRYVADSWLGERAAEFRKQLAAASYADVADRPLLLCQLLFLFIRNGYLPDQQSAIYRRLTNLLLQEWDAERGIHRTSRYSDFLPERKSEFLAALAYDLTYRIKTRVFSENDLIRSYDVLHLAFGLPQGEANAVVREIESHSGIIIEASGKFEFSHLSLQEYLCAEYMVREPFPQHIDHYVAEYPAPLAVAIALSSNSSAWFSTLILKHAPSRFNAQNIESLLARLTIERPHLVPTPQLGMALLALFDQFLDPEFQDTRDLIERFISDFGLDDALKSALLWYVVDADESIGSKYVALGRRLDLEDKFGVVGDENIKIPKPLFRRLLNSSSHALTYRDGNGVLGVIDGSEMFVQEPKRPRKRTRVSQ
ncbi:MAG: NACHT domain-containing protein [Acidobacteriota bacterium]|nr:NACHT domain-containing protein [Acidobacteriota bacterium]